MDSFWPPACNVSPLSQSIVDLICILPSLTLPPLLVVIIPFASQLPQPDLALPQLLASHWHVQF